MRRLVASPKRRRVVDDGHHRGRGLSVVLGAALAMEGHGMPLLIAEHRHRLFCGHFSRGALPATWRPRVPARVPGALQLHCSVKISASTS